MDVGVIFYSDRKVSLELSLTLGSYSIPKINVNNKKQIINEINKRWKINCEEFNVLKEENITYIIVNDWENKLKSRRGHKMIWFNLNKAIEKTNGFDKQSLTFFMNSYKEVMLNNHKQVGIAKNEECIKYNLITKAIIIAKEDKILTFNDNNKYKTHLIEPNLGEFIEDKLNIEEISKIYVNEPKRYSLNIIKIKDENLTFLDDKQLNLKFIHKNELNCPIISKIM